MRLLTVLIIMLMVGVIMAVDLYVRRQRYIRNAKWISSEWVSPETEKPKPPPPPVTAEPRWALPFTCFAIGIIVIVAPAFMWFRDSFLSGMP